MYIHLVLIIVLFFYQRYLNEIIYLVRNDVEIDVEISLGYLYPP